MNFKKLLKRFFRSGVSTMAVHRPKGLGGNRMNINGIKITGNYKSITCQNGKIFLDGKEYIPEDKEEKNITLIFENNVGTLSVDEAQRVEVRGNVTGDVKTMSGDVIVKGNIEGNAKTMSGDIECEILKGKADTMSGDIVYKGR